MRILEHGKQSGVNYHWIYDAEHSPPGDFVGDELRTFFRESEEAFNEGVGAKPGRRFRGKTPPSRAPPSERAVRLPVVVADDEAWVCASAAEGLRIGDEVMLLAEDLQLAGRALCRRGPVCFMAKSVMIEEAEQERSVFWGSLLRDSAKEISKLTAAAAASPTDGLSRFRHDVAEGVMIR